MSERVNGDRQLADQVSTDQVKYLVTTLNEEDKRALAAELARDVLSDEANTAAVVEAVKTASGEAKQEVVAEAVRVALPASLRVSSAERPSGGSTRGDPASTGGNSTGR